MEEILENRNKTHGDYETGCKIAQELENVVSNTKNWMSLSPGKKIAIKMIFLKISRITEGDSNFQDHWIDIAGYAERAKNAC